MNEPLRSVLVNTNWKLLAQQKLVLLQVIHAIEAGEAQAIDPVADRALDGLLHWIDIIQDACFREGMPVEWLEGDKETGETL